MRPSRWDAAAALIVLAAIGIALVWLLKMPILQCADEDNHYDYALTVATAGRPITGAEGDTEPDTHPSLRYLIERTRTFGIRFDQLERVPAGYGTPDFYQNLDSGAPPIDVKAFHDGPISPVPYISKLYPVLYYGLVAGVVRVVGVVAPGSIVAPFFAARLFSVFLMTIALAFSWGLIKLLCPDRRLALGLFACTALFPLTTQIGACIQPDNLSFALVAAALYFAMHFMRSPAKTWAAVAFALTITLLIATKRQYFLAVYLAAAFAFAVMAAGAPRIRRVTGALLAGMTVFPAMAYAYTATLMRVPATARQMCPGTLADALKGLPDHSTFALMSFSAYGLASQFASTFFGGNAMWMFWLSFGSFVNEMTLGTPIVTTFVFGMILGGTVVVLLLLLWRLAVNARRLFLVARRRSVLSALRVATGNIAVNACFTFALILFAYEAWVGGFVAIQGRYWLPFLPVIWFISVTIALRVRPRSRAIARRKGLLALLFIYLAIANVFIVPSLEARYYSPPKARIAADETLFELLADGRVPISNSSLGPFHRGATLDLVGLAFDRRTPGPATEVVLRVGNALAIRARPWRSLGFACANTDTALKRIAFRASISTASLEPGTHPIRAFVTTPWSRGPIDEGVRATITVIP